MRTPKGRRLRIESTHSWPLSCPCSPIALTLTFGVEADFPPWPSHLLFAAYKVLLLTLENILLPLVNVSRIFHEVTLFSSWADFLVWTTVGEKVSWGEASWRMTLDMDRWLLQTPLSVPCLAFGNHEGHKQTEEVFCKGIMPSLFTAAGIWCFGSLVPGLGRQAPPACPAHFHPHVPLKISGLGRDKCSITPHLCIFGWVVMKRLEAPPCYGPCPGFCSMVFIFFFFF